MLDVVEVFTDGGPMTGEMKTANSIFAATGQIAVDAVGLAVLQDLGSNQTIMSLF